MFYPLYLQCYCTQYSVSKVSENICTYKLTFSNNAYIIEMNQSLSKDQADVPGGICIPLEQILLGWFFCTLIKHSLTF